MAQSITTGATGAFGDRTQDRTLTRSSPAYQAYQILHVAFIIAPVVAGIDKFFHVMVNLGHVSCARHCASVAYRRARSNADDRGRGSDRRSSVADQTPHWRVCRMRVAAGHRDQLVNGARILRRRLARFRLGPWGAGARPPEPGVQLLKNRDNSTSSPPPAAR